MSRIRGEFRSMLGYTGLFSLCGIASLLVLMYGPSYGVGLAYQIIFIGMLLLTMPVLFVVDVWRRRRDRRREELAEGDGGESGRAVRRSGKEAAAPAREYPDLTRGAEETVQWLRSTKLGVGSGADEVEDVVYALPWFVVAGPPNSGKTSLVLSSGLNFQTLPNQRHAEHRLVRPTRGCDWRITDAAVFLDTCGRYQVEEAGDEEWAALADTLTRYRKRRPLDGFVIAVSVEWVSLANEAEKDQYARTLRTRLDDMMRRTGMRFPVYLVWTKADSFEGFEQFFGRLSRAERGEEVWGATFPLEWAKQGNTTGLLDVEFDALVEAVSRQGLVRLGASDPPAEQLAVFNFPTRFSEAREAMAHFTSALFLRDPFRELPLVRGFYLTANVGGGQRAKGAPAAGAGDGATVVGRDEEAQPTVSTRTLGEGFFVERFFKDVLLRDKDLAAALQPAERRHHRLRLALLLAATLLSVGLLTAFIISYRNNRELLQEARERAAHVEERTRRSMSSGPGAQEPLEAQLDIQALERLRETVATLDKHEREGTPSGLGFLLYAGDEINSQARAIYFEAVTQRYFKPTLAALEKDLSAFASGSPVTPAPAGAEASSPDGGGAPSEEEILGKYYDLLKAYLMLTSEPGRVEPTFLSAQLNHYWRTASPPNMEQVSREQLDFYARQANRPGAPRAKANEKLLAQARTRLAAYPAINRFYKRVTTESNARTKEVSVASVLGGRGGGVLSGAYTVPGSYTVTGFRDHISPAFKSASEEISKEDWVTGAVKEGARAPEPDMGKLWSLYFRDYTDHWRQFMRRTEIVDLRSRDEAVRALGALTATNSPIELVVEAVAHNTNLSAAPQTSGVFDWIKSLFRRNRAYNTQGNSEVEREFRPLIEFASAEKNKDAVAVSQYRASLQQVLEALSKSSPDQISQTSSMLMTGKDDINLQQSEQAIERQLGGFVTAASGDAAGLLRKPLYKVREMLYGSGYADIVKEWRDQLYPLARRVESGYPFTPTGNSSLSELAGYLNPVDGKLTVFFNTRLASSFNEVQGELKLKESGGFKFSDEFVKYLNNARRLRAALFPNEGKQPKVNFNYDVILQHVPGADVLLEIDGSRVESRGSAPASANFFFPSRDGGSSGVSIKVTDSGGQTHPFTRPGEWGLFKLLQEGGSSSGDNSYSLSIRVGPANVRATLRPTSPVSPFDRTLFTNLRAPSEVAR